MVSEGLGLEMVSRNLTLSQRKCRPKRNGNTECVKFFRTLRAHMLLGRSVPMRGPPPLYACARCCGGKPIMESARLRVAASVRMACASALVMVAEMAAAWCGKKARGEPREDPYTVVSHPSGSVAERASCCSSQTSVGESAPVLSVTSSSTPWPLPSASA